MRRLGVRDMGVKFHPSVELELIERVKRRRAEHRTAAEQVADAFDLPCRCRAVLHTAWQMGCLPGCITTSLNSGYCS